MYNPIGPAPRMATLSATRSFARSMACMATPKRLQQRRAVSSISSGTGKQECAGMIMVSLRLQASGKVPQKCSRWQRFGMALFAHHAAAAGLRRVHRHRVPTRQGSWLPS